MRAHPMLRWIAIATCCGLGCSDVGGDAGTDTSSSDVGSASVDGTAPPTTNATASTTTDASVTATASSDDGAASSETGAMTTAADSTGDGPPQVSPGCGVPATVGASARTIEVAGVMRSYALAIPDPYDPEVPRPLVFGFHGLGGTGSGYYIPGGLNPAPIIVGPNAEPPGGAWNTSGDLELVDAIVAELGDELCIDLDRVFASGYSNGGFMADAVACQRSDLFRGVAIMEGGSSGGACGQTAMWIMHNQDDMSVPIDYGNTLRDQWVAANGCAATTQPIAPEPCVQYDGCTAGNPVVWCSPATGGHNPNYDAAAAVPAFFDSL